MKRYIKSAVVTDVYLTDWIEKHKDDHPDIIVINDRTPYTGDWEEAYDGSRYIDCPGVVFYGTYEGLISGEDNLLFETYGEEEYQEKLARYLVLEEEDIINASRQEHWIDVYSV